MKGFKQFLEKQADVEIRKEALIEKLKKMRIYEGAPKARIKRGALFGRYAETWNGIDFKPILYLDGFAIY